MSTTGLNTSPQSIDPKVPRPRVKIILAATVILAMILGLVGVPWGFGADGAGTDRGPSYGNTGNVDASWYFYDSKSAGSNYPQGTGTNSINYFLNRAGLSASSGSGPYIVNSCNDALQRAAANGGSTAANSRVVGIIWIHGSNNRAGYGVGRGQRLVDQLNEWKNSGYSNFYGDSKTITSSIYSRMYNQIVADTNGDLSGANSSNWLTAACVAANENEPPSNYKLSISTLASDTVGVAGSSTGVRDQITATSSGSHLSETLNAEVYLNYAKTYADAAAGKSLTHASKTAKISNNGSSYTPYFYPSDFKADKWWAGWYWFTVRVPKQGSMDNGPVTHGETAIAGERWETKYDLSISTLAVDTPAVAGSEEQVFDRVTTNTNQGTSSDKITESLSVTTTLHWGGFSDSSGEIAWTDTRQLSASKTWTMNTDETAASPTFSPVDFGWNEGWAAGQYWFETRIESTDWMNNGPVVSGSTPVAGERWSVIPPGSSKELTDAAGNATTEESQVTAGMEYTARIKAFSAGASQLVIRDYSTVKEVYFGAAIADDPGNIWVEDAAGEKVAAKISISETSTGRIVQAELVLREEPSAVGWYTLVVPTYAWPTGSDYTLADYGESCWDDGSLCYETDDWTIDKVTPTPDKVWVLDEAGALSAYDPEHTNAAGADGQVFLPGSEVAAVVNGHIPAHLAANLTAYRIADDWSEAAQYVDFTEISQVKVFRDGKDVTDQFTVSLDGTTTIATANQEFLDTTSNLEADSEIKLVIFGEFYPVTEATDTQGRTIALYNSGWETYNNETIRTNEPPIYVWNPDPQKHVVASATQNGDQSTIDGKAVYAGQYLEYQVNIDLNIPGESTQDTKIANFQVRDNYDELFVPNKTSVEFYDARTMAVISRQNWSITWDEESHSFTATFTPEWIAENLYPGMTGWLIMRFDGYVDASAPGGSSIENTAFEIINHAETPTNTTVNPVPEIAPHKSVFNRVGEDIDGQTVVMGDTLVYQLTMDAGPARSEIAYDVHKLGMIDDFDEEYLSLTENDVQVVDAQTGIDVTSKFNVQILDGKAYVFAKQVESTNVNGELIPGNPQPENLEEYAAAGVEPTVTPIIDQSLLGTTYYLYLRATVTKAQDGYVIYNSAQEIIEETSLPTETTKNPLVELEPTKDVTATVGGESLHQGEIGYEESFHYQLNSSVTPANRAYALESWWVTDTYNSVADQYAGEYEIVTNTDLYTAMGELAFAAGTTVASARLEQSLESKNEVEEAAGELVQVVSGSEYFTVTDDGTGELTVKAEAAFLDLVNANPQLAQSWTVNLAFTRLAYGNAFENVFVETYNNAATDSNRVWTDTPGDAQITFVKYDVASGEIDGDRNTPSEQLEVQGDIVIGFKITNTGTVPVHGLTLVDETTQGTGIVENIEFDIPLEKITLAPGESITGTGTLTGIAVGSSHVDVATVTGVTDAGMTVTDSDPWHGISGEEPEKLAKTGVMLIFAFLAAIGVIGLGGYLILRQYSRF